MVWPWSSENKKGQLDRQTCVPLNKRKRITMMRGLSHILQLIDGYHKPEWKLLFLLLYFSEFLDVEKVILPIQYNRQWNKEFTIQSPSIINKSVSLNLLIIIILWLFQVYKDPKTSLLPRSIQTQFNIVPRKEFIFIIRYRWSILSTLNILPDFVVFFFIALTI